MDALGCRARTKIRDFIIVIGFWLFVYRIGASDGWRFFTVNVVIVAAAAAVTAAVDASILLLLLIVAVDRIAIVIVVGQVALATIPATATVRDLVIVAAAITVVCIVVVVVVDAGSAAIGAVTATATCAVTYARLWFDSYGSRHVVVPIVNVVRGGRSGCEHRTCPAVYEAVRSVQCRPQLDSHLAYVRRRRRRIVLQDTTWFRSFRR